MFLSTFCLISGGALSLGVLRDTVGNKAIFYPLVTICILFSIAWLSIYYLLLINRK